MKKNKFTSQITLSGADIKGKRAGLISSQVESAQKALVNTLEAKKNDLEMKLDSLTDLAPTSTTSLKVGGKDFSASQWVQDVQSTKVALEEAKLELQIAEETLKEWFTEEVADQAPSNQE